MEFLVVLAVVLLAAAVLSAPLRQGRGERAVAQRSAEEADLEAARDAKYAEIREAELDLRTGKLSAEDHRALDAELRAEAVAILRRLDELRDE